MVIRGAFLRHTSQTASSPTLMALRFGPKQAIDAFLPAADADVNPSDPREPPHPDPDPSIEESLVEATESNTPAEPPI